MRGKTEHKRTSTCWFTFQMARVARAGPGQSQQPRTKIQGSHVGGKGPFTWASLQGAGLEMKQPGVE